MNSSLLENGSKQFKRNDKTNIMIRQTLSNQFNSKQWAQISSTPPKTFHHLQETIFHYLMFNSQLFQNFFQKFYSNHVRLYHWHLLAKEKHYQIKSYVFMKLLNKKLQDYQDELKHLEQMKDKQKNKNKEVKYSTGKSSWKESLDQISYKIFKLLSDKPLGLKKQVKKPERPIKTSQVEQRANNASSPKTAQHQTKTAHRPRLNENRKRNFGFESMINLKKYDFHDLYVKTFHACDGQRYVFYNHEKHMKGISEMRSYNNFIRKKLSKEKQKFADFGNFQQRNSERRFQSEQLDEQRSPKVNSIYNLEPFGQVEDEEKENKKNFKSQVIFRRYKRYNLGKFIRK